MYHFIYSRSVPFEGYLENYINELSLLKNNGVSDYINEKDKDVNFIKNSWVIKEILRMNVTGDEEAVRTAVNEILNIAVKDVVNYFIFSEEKTLFGFKNDIQFNRFAVQKVGGDGYTSIIDKNSGNILFHKHPAFVGLNLLEDESVNEDLKNLIRLNLEQGHAAGFYEWMDLDGEIKSKYLSISDIPIETSDGFKLAIASTAYLDDFHIVNEVTGQMENNLFNFKEYFEYDNLIIVSKAGHAIYMVDEKSYLGTNIQDWKFGSFLEAFNEVNQTKETVVFGPFFEYNQKDVLKIGIISSVYDKGEFLGYVLLIQKIDAINNILENFKGLKETGDTYMTNKEKLLITSPRFKNFDLLAQEIKTDNMDHCVEYMKKIKGKEVAHEEKEIYEYLNYYGDFVLGTYSVVFKTGWCIVVEFGETELFKNKLENKYLYIIFLSFTLLVILLFFVKYYIDKRYKVFSGSKK
ncbi:hypothetical protein KAS08_05455 [Candidatus Pacearchaeota archaeon]|nr:hypothetical protein [Candidatus Pacearchaeota archaeon]